MDAFEPWEHASTAEEAARKIAYRLAEMQRLYSEAVMLADAFELSVSGVLQVPEGYTGGHNHSECIHWSHSSKYC